MTTTSPSPSSPSPMTTSKQNRLREKAEEINLVLLQPNVDLWKLRELAISEGGLVNDTIRRRAWPKLVGLSSHNNNPDDVRGSHDNNNNKTSSSSTNKLLLRKNHNNQKGTAPNRVTNFGQYDTENQRNAKTGGIFDQHDTAGTATGAGADDGAAAANATTTAAMQETDDNDNTSLAESINSIEPSNVVSCVDADQIERDVTRCTWHLLTGGQRTRRRLMLNKHRKKISTILRQKQRRLGDLINLTLAVSERGLVPPPPRGDNHNAPSSYHEDDSDRLCYYQGYHDVASIFLAALGGASTKGLVSTEQEQQHSSTTTAAAQAASMGLDLSSKVLYQVSLSHFREPMRANFLQLQTTLKMVLLPLLNVIDPELHAHLWGCGMEPFFALSWLLTWFSHDIRDTVLVKRLFDFFLVSHPLMPIYLSVAMLCHPSNRKEILATPCEFAELHNVLQGLPKNSSMVGWKWSVGVDGYVSDDEQVGEDGETSISLDSDMASHPSSTGGGNRGQQSSLRSGSGDGGGIMRREDLILSEGQAHVVSMGIPAHVPFQELIDTAISFMGRVPPRELRSIAIRYFDEQDAQPILELYPSITFFHQLPSWTLAATAKADWVLKQRSRDRRALTELRNRNNNTTITTNRTTRTAAPTDNNTTEATTCWTSDMVAKRAKDMKYPKAMIAQGFGPGEQAIARHNKRRKFLMIGGAATVALFAIGLGMAIQYRGPYPQRGNDSGSSGGRSDFDTEREEAVSYVKSTKMPSWQRRRKSRGSAASECAADSGWPGSSALSNVDQDVGSTNDSIIQAYFQRYVMRELQLVYAKFRLVLGTLAALSETIQDPNFSDNVQATLSQMTQTVVSVQDPEVRAAIHKGVAKRAAQATQVVGGFAQNVGGIASNVFKWTARQARSHLGGTNFEQLGLL